MNMLNNTNILSISNVTFFWESNSKPTLKNLNFYINRGEFIGIIGPSGCGKSTLLSLISGLEQGYTGTIKYNNRLLKNPSKDIGVVFQEYGLFPWLTVKKNIEFSLNLNGLHNETKNKSSLEILKKIQLEQHAEKYPHELSGGMRQRVAIARSLINNPKILLMDEPFGALDYNTRLNMNQLLLDIWNEYKNTIIFVTHDIMEAILLSDRIFLMKANPGEITEVLDINLERPRNIHSKDFIDYLKKIQNHLGKES